MESNRCWMYCSCSARSRGAGPAGAGSAGEGAAAASAPGTPRFSGIAVTCLERIAQQQRESVDVGPGPADHPQACRTHQVLQVLPQEIMEVVQLEQSEEPAVKRPQRPAAGEAVV